MEFITKITERHKIEICFVNLMILLYLFRTSIPLFKFPFIVLYFGFFVYVLIVYRNRIISTVFEFFQNYLLLLLLAIFVIISFCLSSKIYLTVFKDIVNMIVLFSLVIFSMLVVASKKEFSFSVINLLYLLIIFAFIISFFGILDLLNITSLNDFSEIDEKGNMTQLNPISIDYNFSLVPVFFGMISVFYFLCMTNSKIQKLSYNILLSIFSLNILLSGSRRGFLLLIVIFLVLLTIQFVFFFKEDSFIKKLRTNSVFFILYLIFLPLFLIVFFLNSSFSYKTKTLEALGTKNVIIAKTKISLNMFRYISAFDKKITFTEVNQKVWTIGFDPADPDSGWGTRIHKTIYPLSGENVEIVPKAVKGYYMDKTCNASYYSSDNLSESYTQVADLLLNEGDKYQGSVYCYVSNDFNGSAVCFGNMLSYVFNGTVSGKPNACYDLKTKGVWKKLEIEYDCKKGETSLVLSFTRLGVKDFSSLEGYVIFAYPQNIKINSLEDNVVRSTGNKMNITSKIDNKHSNLLGKKYKNSSMFIPMFSLSILETSFNNQKDTDPIRNWVSRFISEDTTYYPFKSNFVVDTISNSFSSPRIVRWQFASQIFLREYNWKQKLFGGGFDFLNWYGYYFYNDKTRSDYPHNPFLSVLLYSGILGLIIYLFFIYKVFYYYIKYFKEYKILAVFFLITFFFSFFSAGSPFDPPIMGFFVILPFFIHSVHEREKK
jgi:hypothetical protein